MSEGQRRRWSAGQKAAIVRRHLADKTPVSDLADELGVQPSLVYLWVRQVLDQAERIFEHAESRRGGGHRDQRIAKLEQAIAQRDAKLQQKNEVISELLEEHVQLKKELGEP